MFPIDTAPRDGAPVVIVQIVVVPISGPTIWRLQGAFNILDKSGIDEWFDLQGDFSISWKPTHWVPMPLPEAN